LTENEFENWFHTIPGRRRRVKRFFPWAGSGAGDAKVLWCRHRRFPHSGIPPAVRAHRIKADAMLEIAQPFQALSPEFVMDAVESQGFVCDCRNLTLNSYENRVYQVGVEDGRAADRQVLPPRALERGADPGGAPVLFRAGGAGAAGGRPLA
jgi:hypothetical protein